MGFIGLISNKVHVTVNLHLILTIVDINVCARYRKAQLQRHEPWRDGATRPPYSSYNIEPKRTQHRQRNNNLPLVEKFSV